MTVVCILTIFVNYSEIIPVIYSFLAPLPISALAGQRSWNDLKRQANVKVQIKRQFAGEQEGQSRRQPQEEDVRK